MKGFQGTKSTLPADNIVCLLPSPTHLQMRRFFDEQGFSSSSSISSLTASSSSKSGKAKMCSSLKFGFEIEN